jgi:hypothetical protein
MSKKLLQEYIKPADTKTSISLVEDVDQLGNKTKSLYMSGIFIQGNVRNQNERVYPVSEIAKAVHTLNKQINEGYSVLGEVDHPDDLKINLDRVSHMITSMHMDGNDGIGKLKILPTPMGQLVKTMLESGVKLGVSSRGSGNVSDHDGRVSDFEIITVDIVAQPSAPQAYPKAIYESLMNYKNGKNIHEGLSDTSKTKILQDAVKRDILKFIKDMKF